MRRDVKAGLGREMPILLAVFQSIVVWIEEHVPMAPGHLVVGLGVAMVVGTVAAVGDYLAVVGLPATWDLLAAFRLVVVGTASDVAVGFRFPVA